MHFERKSLVETSFSRTFHDKNYEKCILREDRSEKSLFLRTIHDKNYEKCILRENRS